MSEDIRRNKSKKPTEAVNARGSLGLLAVGAVGLKAWREKRKEVEGLEIPHYKDEVKK